MVSDGITHQFHSQSWIPNLIDVVNKAEMTILNSRKYKAIRFCAIDSSGVAKKVDKKDQ